MQIKMNHHTDGTYYVTASAPGFSCVFATILPVDGSGFFFEGMWDVPNVANNLFFDTLSHAKAHAKTYIKAWRKYVP